MVRGDTSQPGNALPAAVWTDLQPLARWPKNLPGVRHWRPVPSLASTDSAQRLGDWLSLNVVDSCVSSLLVDLRNWPPRGLFLKGEGVVAADVAADGRWVFCSRQRGLSNPHCLQFHEPGEPGRRGLKIPASPVYRWPSFDRVMTISGQVYAVSGHDYTRLDEVFRLAGDRLVPVKDLPPAPGEPGTSGRGLWTHGKVTLTDGTDVLIWCGNGYELRGRKLERTWTLNACQDPLWGTLRWGEWSAVAWGDGFFYVSGNEIFQARRGREPCRAWPDADNVQGLTPGPPGSVLVQHRHYRNDRGLIGRIWFPDDDSFVPLRKNDILRQPRQPFGSLHWSAGTRQLYSVGWDDFATVPGDEVLALKRVRPRGARKGVS
jgi:hypothetical protein